MPFDTTYNFVSSDNTHSVTITVPGGDKDTVLNLTTDESPITLTNYREISERSTKTTVAAPKPQPYFGLSPFFIILIIIAVGAFIGLCILPLFRRWLDAIKKTSAPKIIMLVFLLTSIIFLLSGSYDFGFMILMVTFLVAGEFKNEIFYPNRVINNIEESTSAQNSITAVNKPLLKYNGSNLNFTDIEIDSALNKRFPYYVSIRTVEKERFIHRIKNFIADKIFYIHDESGFKEMPILISASAIQLTFGFKKYLLPYFKNIHVFPEEFFRANDLGICFLAGNVSGNNINISWKHFLKGYQDGTDGQNVGLHELAHALYYQALVVENGVDDDFSGSYHDFENHGNKVFDIEMNPIGGLYSEYANKNFQEFWAESAEIFFERPEELKNLYPDLYQTLKEVFNQDPMNLQNPALS